MLTEKDGRLIVDIKVSPRSSVNRIEENVGEIRLRITAAPVDGKANTAVIEFLAKTLNVAKRDIEIVRGETGREKTVAVVGITAQQFRERIGKSG